MKLTTKRVAIFLLVCILMLVFVFFVKKAYQCDVSDELVESKKYDQLRRLEDKDEIAVIDLKRIAIESEAGKSIEKQIAAVNDAARKDLQELESKMKPMEKNKLSESDSRKFEDMQFALYDMVSTKRYQISEAYKKAVLELETEVNKAVAQISEKNNLRIVINLDAVVCSDGRCNDITEEVIQKINETLPHISVVIK